MIKFIIFVLVCAYSNSLLSKELRLFSKTTIDENDKPVFVFKTLFESVSIDPSIGKIEVNIDNAEALDFAENFEHVKEVNVSVKDILENGKLIIKIDNDSQVSIYLKKNASTAVTPDGDFNAIGVDLNHIYYFNKKVETVRGKATFEIDQTGQFISGLKKQIPYAELMKTPVLLKSTHSLSNKNINELKNVIKKSGCNEEKLFFLNKLFCRVADNASVDDKIEVVKKIPFVIKGSFTIGLKESISPQAIEYFFDDFKSQNIQVLNTFPEINSLSVKLDLTEDLNLKNSLSTELYELEMIDKTLNVLNDHEAVEFAAPDLVLTGEGFNFGDFKSISILNSSSNKPLNIHSQTQNELTDWGVTDIQASEIWPIIDDTQSEIGIVEFGFSDHEDLDFREKPNNNINVEYKNHGNHISSIACGIHNSKGYKGVVPNCQINPIIPLLPEGVDEDESLARLAKNDNDFNFINKVDSITYTFNNVFEALYEEIFNTKSDTRVINISLGVNLKSNKIPDIDKIRLKTNKWIKMEAQLLLRTFQKAEKNNIVIYSAAGNDNTNGGKSEAKYGSPINYAAIHSNTCNPARKYDVKCIKTNVGVVVQAHDIDGKRGSFSNKNAMISCPGVNIIGAIAMNNQNKSSISSYGTYSGTSMATPYCAAGHLLFTKLRPDLSHGQIIACLLNVSNEYKVDGVVPMLKLSDALKRC